MIDQFFSRIYLMAVFLVETVVADDTVAVVVVVVGIDNEVPGVPLLDNEVPGIPLLLQDTEVLLGTVVLVDMAPEFVVAVVADYTTTLCCFRVSMGVVDLTVEQLATFVVD